MTHSPDGRLRALVVDDHAAFRELMSEFLREADFTVLEAADAQSALALGEKYAGLIDLLVTDIVMPDMSGPRMVHQLGEWQWRMKVLYISGHTDPSIVHSDHSGKDVRMLTKPFSKDTFHAAVVETMTGTRPDRSPPQLAMLRQELSPDARDGVVHKRYRW